MRVNPVSLAERIVDNLGIDCPEDLLLLEEIAWQRGALVEDGPLTGAEASLVAVRAKAVITVSTTVHSPQRRRFGIAHEIGHLELRRLHRLVAVCQSSDMETWGQRGGADAERQANLFASGLLLPGRLFRPRCTRSDPPSLDSISALADEFDVSLTATALRYLDYCEECVAVVYSHNGYVKWFRGSKDFDGLGTFVNVGECLHSDTYADRFFEGRRVPRGPKRVAASAWFRTGGYRPEASIVEQSWAVPSQNAVLTLLWVDDDIEEDAEWL